MASRSESVSNPSSRESGPVQKVDSTNDSEPLPFPPRKPEPLKNIDSFFDKLERIIERSTQLVMKGKYLIFEIAFLVFLVYEMVHVAHLLASR
jgi:hypothetical protein